MLTNTKILAVFREDENLKAAMDVLIKKGCDVLSGTSVFQAIASVAKRKTDIIVLDIDGLEMNDLEFIDVVRKINPNLFIIVSFSPPNREKAFKSLERGADCYIIKPFYIKELLAVINNFVCKNSRDENVSSGPLERQLSIERMALRIAHEINNPLTTISGHLQLLLLDNKKDGPNCDIYESMEEEAQRIAETVRSLLAYAQLKEPNKTIVDLNDILKDSINYFNEIKHEKNVKIIETLDKDLPPVMADKKQISLVCKNIIANSQKTNGEKGVLSIYTEVGKDNNINATFYDSGNGIPSNVIDKIFDPFFVVNESDKGAGLGLSVSYNIIKKHGGDLTVRDRKGNGTIFQFTLPSNNLKPQNS